MQAERAVVEVADIEQLMTTRDVAERLRISEETLSTWRCTGAQALPYVRVGRLVRYRPSEVNAYLEGRLQAA